jgi:hypothetical protein
MAEILRQDHLSARRVGNRLPQPRPMLENHLQGSGPDMLGGKRAPRDFGHPVAHRLGGRRHGDPELRIGEGVTAAYGGRRDDREAGEQILDAGKHRAFLFGKAEARPRAGQDFVDLGEAQRPDHAVFDAIDKVVVRHQGLHFLQEAQRLLSAESSNLAEDMRATRHEPGEVAALLKRHRAVIDGVEAPLRGRKRTKFLLVDQGVRAEEHGLKPGCVKLRQLLRFVAEEDHAVARPPLFVYSDGGRDALDAPFQAHAGGDPHQEDSRPSRQVPADQIGGAQRRVGRHRRAEDRGRAAIEAACRDAQSARPDIRRDPRIGIDMGAEKALEPVC